MVLLLMLIHGKLETSCSILPSCLLLLEEQLLRYFILFVICFWTFVIIWVNFHHRSYFSLVHWDHLSTFPLKYIQKSVLQETTQQVNNKSKEFKLTFKLSHVVGFIQDFDYNNYYADNFGNYNYGYPYSQVCQI